jgi:hypothetical protein
VKCIRTPTTLVNDVCNENLFIFVCEDVAVPSFFRIKISPNIISVIKL